MCGFVGFCDEKTADSEVKKHIVTEMTERIKHRGPDDFGLYCDEFAALGFARLKIIDLVGGTQPMYSRDGRYVLCFNGEIYNYKELANEQKKDFGERFASESDTEVLLSLLTHYGERALTKLRGMFAFAFYDRKERKMLLARDPFGIKPLYYACFDGCFMFASEIKALLSHPKFKKSFNREMLPYYLQFQYVPTEETAFEGVMRLMPGHMLTFSDKGIEKQRWFDLPRFYKRGYKGYSFFSERDGEKRVPLPYKKNVARTADILLSVLEGAVERHTRADVKVGGFLSGGVDSALISTLAMPERLFTVGFKRADFDERARALETAEGLDIPLDSLEIDADDFFECVDKVQYYSDEPYANLSAIPLYLISKEARKSVGVVLSGEGADELFGGYEWYADSLFGKLYRKLPENMRKKVAKRSRSGRIGDFLRRNSGNAQRDFIGQAHIMTEGEAFSILSKPYKMLKNPTALSDKIYEEAGDASLLRKKMYLDMNLWLPFDILNKADKMTMASSLELRVPYLDLAVLSIAEGCGERLLMRGKTGKYVLRRAALRAVGGEVAYRPKKGFPVPFRAWIREKKYAQILKSAFTGAIGRNFFDADKLCTMLDEHVKGEKNHARALYTVYAFIVWYEIYFEKEAVSIAVLDIKGETVAPVNAQKLLYDTVTPGDKNVKMKIKDESENERIYTDNSRF